MAGEETIALRAPGEHRAERSYMRFYSSWFCPCAQRTWVCLEYLAEAGFLDYNYIAIDPYVPGENGSYTKTPLSLAEKAQKFPDFVAASPRGLVPALADTSSGGENVVNDSLVCCEYLADLYPQAGLMPPSPADRAKVRMFWEHCASQVIPHFYKMLMFKGDQREQARLDFLSGMSIANAKMQAVSPQGGMFLGGNRFSLGDMALGPWMQRIPIVLGPYRGFELPRTEEFARLHQWFSVLNSFPCFARCLVDTERLTLNYIGYADGSATSEVARDWVGVGNKAKGSGSPEDTSKGNSKASVKSADEALWQAAWLPGGWCAQEVRGMGPGAVK
eukprot:CAMPEP_0173422678 /NCGR_PEP_ID=MMETSP1357-20121228/3293_1 /TAXON_ID=77926 /ORGANISM="Hemiselmis rufescens, Strain PCC563" /LENGTH=331 /DNA_ID=CAMNT_0014385723 /DNA_START=27 /DNA_END=1020 /DNA_ORIENTATION=+